MPTHVQTGQRGEVLAARFLEQKGYEIVARNYRAGRAEVDLIARREQWMVFMEVKTRNNLKFGFPEAFVSARKETLLRQAADQYVYETNWRGAIRFDVVAVVVTWKSEELVHFEDVW